MSASRPWRGHLARCLFFILGIALPSCRPAMPVPAPEFAVPRAPEVATPKPQLPPPKPKPAVESAVSAPRVVSWSAGGVSFQGVAFDARSHRLVVVDQADGPGSKFATAGHAARSVRGMAAVNAGFFTPSGAPLGLVVSDGKVAGAWNGTSSLGTGVWLENAAGNARIARREAIGAAAARRMRELLQAGPMLVDGGSPVRGLHGGEPRPRTLIAWDGQHRWWIGCAGPCAMPALAAALASAGNGPGFPVRHALNLDGGRSSELWVGEGIPGGPITRRPLWNRPVRNHLVLLSR